MCQPKVRGLSAPQSSRRCLRNIFATRWPKGPGRRSDLVKREFRVSVPHRLWVADITYVRTRKRVRVHSFVTDVYSRRTLGWALSDSMRTEALLLQTLNQAIVCAEEIAGLIHDLDHGSQYVSIVYNERLADHGIAESTGTVGGSYDNALAENANGSIRAWDTEPLLRWKPNFGSTAPVKKYWESRKMPRNKTQGTSRPRR